MPKKSIVYVTYIIEELYSGYTEKVKSQCFALENLGFQVYLYISKVDRCILYKINKGKTNEIFSQKYKFPFRISLQNNKNIFKLLQKKYHGYIRIKEFLYNLNETNLLKNSEIIYIRRIAPITNVLIKYLKRLKRDGKIVIYEYPTYPWEEEMIKNKDYFRYILDKFYYKKLISLVDYIPVILGKQMKLSNKFISITNGININNIPKKKYNYYCKKKKFHMLGLANVQYWHGYDRLIKGIVNYYNNSDFKNEVYFYVLGKEGNQIDNLKLLVKKYKLEKYILFHGHKSGKELDNLFNLCQVGIGSLGIHRAGVYFAYPLKNREYCARGIPFIISFRDLDFPEKFPYIKILPADESVINIEEIINFYIDIESRFPNYINDMRNYAEKNLSWEIKLKPVIDVLNYKFEK